MKEHELTEKIREQYRKDVLGEKSNRTLEEALQEALDNTTPEHPGAPNHDDEDIGEQDGVEGWI